MMHNNMFWSLPSAGTQYGNLHQLSVTMSSDLLYSGPTQEESASATTSIGKTREVLEKMEVNGPER